MRRINSHISRVQPAATTLPNNVVTLDGSGNLVSSQGVILTQANLSTAQGGGLSSTSAFRIVLGVGQSNAQGQYSTLDANVDVVDPAVWQFGSKPSDTTRYRTIFQASDPLHWNENVGSTTSPATWLGRMYSKLAGAPILLVPCAIGATAMVNSRWQPGNPGGDLFENAVAQANAAVAAAKELLPNSFFDGAYLVQGEADGDAAVSQATYAATLTAFIAGIRARVTGATNSWFLVGQMPYETMQHTGWAGTRAVNAAQIEVCAATPRCKFVPGPRGQTITPGSNRHYTTKGVRTLGCSMAAAIESAKAKAGAEALPAIVAPNTPVTSAVGSTSFDVSWNSVGAVDYKVEISSNNGVSWANVTRVWGDATTLTITGLTATTAYRVRVQAVFVNGSSAWVETTRTTAAGTSTPPSVTQQPTNATVTAAATATFTAAFAGSPTPTIKWQRNAGGNTSFIDIAGATSTSYITPATTVSGGSANNGDTYRAVGSDGQNTATTNIVTLTVNAAATQVSYTFESDTAGASPAGITFSVGAGEVNTPSIANWSKAFHSTTTSGSSNAVSMWAKLNNMASLADQQVTWKRGRSVASVARDGIVLRVVNNSTVGGGYTGAEQGYWFQYNGQTGTARIFALTASGPSPLGTGNISLPEVDERFFRATAQGTTLTFEHSADGLTGWTNIATVTDSTFTAAGGVAAFSGANAANPAAGWFDNIVQTAL